MTNAMDVVAPSTPGKEAQALTSAKKTSVQMNDILKTISYINRGVELSQPRLLQRAVRQNVSLRRYVKTEQLSDLVEKVVLASFNCPTRELMTNMISKLPSTPLDESDLADLSNEIEGEDVDGGASAMDVVGDSANGANKDGAKSSKMLSPPSAILPEVETFIIILIITTLLRYNQFSDAAYLSAALVERIRTFNRRSMDVLAAKSYFYYSLSFEKVDKLDSIRPSLLALYRTCCVRHDEMGQAVLLNLILRNYIKYNLFQQAQIFSVRTSFPENASNNQFCRYLYYMARVQAVQLEYSEAYQRLLMAIRKAPQEIAVGFAAEAQKLAIIVQLLMGEIPERSIFNQANIKESLKPYLAMTQAVRTGDSEIFATVLALYEADFKADKNYSLVKRLSYNVLRTGLRKLSLSYSNISLADIATKLRLPSATSAEYICAKAIREGVIEAVISHETGCLSSSDVLNLYATEEPQKAFHKRIAFCLDVHNEAVKSMRYPPDAYKKELSKTLVGGKEVDEKTIDELIKDMEEDD